MIEGYIRTSGKRPVEAEENRVLHPSPPDGDYGAVYTPGAIVRIDIDDFSHKTGEIEDPVRGAVRSAAVIQYLDANSYKYNAIRTEHGVHIIMGMPESFPIESNRLNWYCALGVRIEAHVTKVIEPIVVNGMERTFFCGSIDNGDIDQLAPGLYPIQKSKDKPFFLEFEAGNRNNHFSEYAFHLVNKGLNAEAAREVIYGINYFFSDDPLTEQEIETILRPETMEKLKNATQVNADKRLSHVAAGQEIIDRFGVIRYQRQFYCYVAGVYVPMDEELIEHSIRKYHPNVKQGLVNETIAYLRGITYTQDTGSNDLINVKNGFLKLDPFSRTVQLLPHSREIKSFRQFNAAYNQNAESKILNDTLERFFDGDVDLIRQFRQMMGYLLMDSTIFQKCFFFVGLPSSGKSKILNMVTAFCGREFVSSLSLKDLDDRFRAAGIIGKVANINADLEKAKIQSSGNFKSLVTGDGITLERKNEKPIDNYVNRAKLIFACNQYPDFSRDSEGIFRRVMIFPCNHVFSKADPDFNPHIDRDLQSPESLSCLLNMAIDGYFDLVENDGFIITQAAEKAGEEFKQETNNIFRWMSENELDIDYFLRQPITANGGGIYEDYCRFCVECGEEPQQQKDFSRLICSEYGLETYRKRVPGTDQRVRRFRRKG